MTSSKVAIIHDWLVSPGGSENVLAQLIKLFPEADLYTLLDLLPDERRGFLGAREIHSSFLNKLPFISPKNYRWFTFLGPFAAEQLELSQYDFVISNCHAFVKGVLTDSNQAHISYVHTPLRYAWLMQSKYLKRGARFVNFMTRIFLHYLRIWDSIASARPDFIIANSRFVQQRIKKIYRRDSKIIYPPVDTHFYTPVEQKENYYIVAGRMVAYKHFDVIMQAFHEMPEKKLLVIGEGPESRNLKKLLAPNILWRGYCSSEELRSALQKSKALIFAAEEDFGILPLEAQACGTPVIAFSKGGALETVNGLDKEQPTGVFFPSQDTTSVIEAVELFEKNLHRFSWQACRNNAERFGEERFRIEFSELINKLSVPSE